MPIHTTVLLCALAVTFLLPGLAAAQEGPKGWTLVWSDEFEGEGLPDPAKWDYEEGFIRNNEAQYYTRARAENARVEDGHLVIEGRKERFENPRYDPQATRGPATRPAAEYTAASVITKGKAAWTFGRVEVRAKLPHGTGVWPAIWMLGSNIDTVGWPACGEIDIMEFVGKDPNHVHGTVHYRKDGKHVGNGEKLVTPAPYDAFHVYAVEWFPDRIDFFFDDTKYFTFPTERARTESGENPFHKPHYLLINLALGGSWGGPVIDDAIFPQPYLIDYVRVYQQDEMRTTSRP